MSNYQHDVLYFHMNKPYYIISGLELDVEFDYLPSEEKALAVEDIQNIIEERGITIRTGHSTIHPDDIIYVPSTGSIDYANLMFEYADEAFTQ